MVPKFYPSQIPGVHQFLPTTPGPGQGEEVQVIFSLNSCHTIQNSQGEYLQNLSREDLETLMQLGGLSVPQLMGEVRLMDWRSRNLVSVPGEEAAEHCLPAWPGRDEGDDSWEISQHSQVHWCFKKRLQLAVASKSPPSKFVDDLVLKKSWA